MVILFYTEHTQMIAASFLRSKSVLKRPSKFLTSSLFSWLKLNEEKCELAGIGVLTFKKHKEKSRSSVFLKLKT